MTPEEIHTLFAKAFELFKPVLGQPTDTDMERIHKDIMHTLLSIPYNENGGKYNLVSLIMADSKYTALYR